VATRGRLFSRFYELKEELAIIFTPEDSELAALLSDKTWCNKVPFLADTSHAFYSLDKRKQGREKENILTVLTKLTLLRKNSDCGEPEKKGTKLISLS
jgi:hypothetical protein